MSGTNVDLALLAVRLIGGAIFAAHGAQKLFGAFGGGGMDPIVGMLGPVVGWLVAIGEFFGGLGLLAGLLSRFSAASLIVIMIGAIVKVHGQHGFFLGQRPGYEYNLALIGLMLPVLLVGPGRMSLAKALPVRRAALE